MLNKFGFHADWLGDRHIAGIGIGANEFISVISAILNDFKDTYT